MGLAHPPPERDSRGKGRAARSRAVHPPGVPWCPAYPLRQRDRAGRRACLRCRTGLCRDVREPQDTQRSHRQPAPVGAPTHRPVDVGRQSETFWWCCLQCLSSRCLSSPRCGSAQSPGARPAPARRSLPASSWHRKGFQVSPSRTEPAAGFLLPPPFPQKYFPKEAQERIFPSLDKNGQKNTHANDTGSL